MLILQENVVSLGARSYAMAIRGFSVNPAFYFLFWLFTAVIFPVKIMLSRCVNINKRGARS